MDYTKENLEVVTAISKRIVRLMKDAGKRRQIMRLRSAWPLYDMGLRTSDLNPSYGQVAAALALSKTMEGK